MPKDVVGKVKLQIPAGNASPAPPVGPALGQYGVNIMDFCNQFNERTQDQSGLTIPVIITIYSDRTFSFVTKTPPASVLLLKAAGIEKGAGEVKDKAGEITLGQAKEIAQNKLADLNTLDLEAAVKIVIGTAKSMGIKVSGDEGK